MSPRRDLRAEEAGVIAALALVAPDLAAVRDRLMAVLSVAGIPGADPAGPGAGALEPRTWRDLPEAVRLGIPQTRDARRYVNLPEPRPGTLRQVVWLKTQRGGALPRISS